MAGQSATLPGWLRSQSSPDTLSQQPCPSTATARACGRQRGAKDSRSPPVLAFWVRSFCRPTLTRWALDFNSLCEKEKGCLLMCLCWTENPPQAGTCQELPIWKTKQKTWMLYINGSCRVVHAGTVRAHTHTPGFTVQVKGLIRDERRPHIAPCKGPLSPFLLQWSVKLWETNDLQATALCATAEEKEGGGGSSFVGGPASLLSRLPTTSPPCHPCAQHRGVSHASSSCCSPVSHKTGISVERARHPSPPAQAVFPPGWLLKLNGWRYAPDLLLLICTFSYH